MSTVAELCALPMKGFSRSLESLGRNTSSKPWYPRKLQDRNASQTVHAKNGSAAVPTADFISAEELLEQIAAKGRCLVYSPLHVGLGIFRPASVDSLGMITRCTPNSTVCPRKPLQTFRQAGGNGGSSESTTSIRTLRQLVPVIDLMVNSGWTNIFIKPDTIQPSLMLFNQLPPA